MRALRTFVTVAVAAWWTASAARADVVILPVTTGGQRRSELERLYADVELALDARGTRHRSGADVRADFLVSRRPFAHPTPQEYRALERELRTAHRGMSSKVQDQHRAVESMQVIRSKVEAAPEAFLQPADRLDTLHGACLGATGAYRALGEEAAALELAKWCLFWLDRPLDLSFAPPFLMPIFEQAERELAEELTPARAIQFTIESSPPGCDLHINGHLRGATGKPVVHVARPGHPYSFYTVCHDGTTSQVQTLGAHRNGTHVYIDPQLEEAVRTDGSGLELHYEGDSDAVRQHARLLRNALHADAVIVISKAGDFRLRRVENPGAAVIGLGEQYTQDELRRALDTILKSPRPPRPPKVEAKLPSTGAHGTADQQRNREQQALKDYQDYERSLWRRRLIVGGTVLALGVGSFATAGALFAKRTRAGARLRSTDQTDADYPAKLADWEDTRPAPYGFGAAGLALATSGALTMLLSSAPERIPRLASAGILLAGVALASWGIVDIARGGACNDHSADPRRCVLDLQQRDRGALVLLSAVPLLSFSLTHLIQRALAPSWTPHSAIVVHPSVYPLQRTIFFDARIHWS